MRASRRRFNPVLFDLDGTLVDSAAGIVASLEAALRACGTGRAPGVDLASFVGLPLDRIFAALAPSTAIPMLVEAYRRDYESRGLPSTSPMPGAAESIGELYRAGVTMAVVTYKPLPYAERMLDATGLRRYFRVVVGRAMGADGRSKAYLIGEALNSLSASSGLPVYIGDHEEDRRAANEAAIHFLQYGPDDWTALTEDLLRLDDGAR